MILFLKLDDMKKEYYYVTDDCFPEELEVFYKQNEINIYKGV